MPVRSMTGFGQASVEVEGRVLSAEIRTVNHRFLEISPRLPRGFQNLEGKLRALLQEKLDRGKVNLTVTWEGETQSGVLTWDRTLAGQYFEQLQELRHAFDFAEPVTLSHLTAHPELFRYSEPDIDAEIAWSALARLVDASLADLVAMREREGDALARDLRERLRRIRTSVAAVEARSPERAREAKEKLRARIADLLNGEAAVEEERILTEAAYMAERMDCTEECVRLVSHCDQFDELLDSGEAIGRKLNFLLQEMNREANTIGSKGNDVAVARDVIQLKEEIEILREQVQNIE